MPKVFQRICKVLVWCVGFVLALILTLEGWHHHKYGHFVGYGLHADMILGNSDVGKNDTYYAVLKNLSVTNYQIEGCRMPGGIAGSGIYFQWDVQRFNRSRNDWDSLGVAKNWVPEPFDSERWDGCSHRDIWQIPPFSSRATAWVFKDWVTNGDVVRMAIHTSLGTPADQQMIIYTPTFTVVR
jgi:hypothetical protein